MGKLLDLKELCRELDSQRAHGKKVVFTNGCFDIIHAGHVRYLRESKAMGDILVVALNSDASIRVIKGNKRPITPQAERAEVLSELCSIDYITIFDEPTPLKVIESVKPDLLVKGEDWQEGEIVGADMVRDWGGEVVRMPLVKGVSTTDIVKRIIEVYKDEEK